MITQEQLKELLDYDPDTGIFTWKVDRIAIGAGRKAGWLSPRGYIYITINSRRYLAHRLVWLYAHGFLPSELDHINRDASDNRLCNLRVVTGSQNNRNRRDNWFRWKHEELRYGA